MANAQQAAAAIPDSQAQRLLDSFSSFLTVSIHNILYYRALYPPPTFLSARAYNLPVHQSRHPKVCAWVRDAVEAVTAQLAGGHVRRVAVAVHAPLAESVPGNPVSGEGAGAGAGGAVLERWVFDLSWFPAWPGGTDAARRLRRGQQQQSQQDRRGRRAGQRELGRQRRGGGLGRDDDDLDSEGRMEDGDGSEDDDGDEDEDEEESTEVEEDVAGEDEGENDGENDGEEYEDEAGNEDGRRGRGVREGKNRRGEGDDGRGGDGGINWVDVDEALRGAIRRMAHVAEKMKPLERGCTYTIALELRDTSPAPIGHPQAWIPAQANARVPSGMRGLEAEPRGGGNIERAQTKPIRAVEVGPLFFECWVEEG